MSRLLRKIIWCFLFLLALWLGGMQWFALQIPLTTMPDTAHADAIVVLTGGKNRLEYGLQLLASGHADKLFISGVHEAITQEQLVNLVEPDLRQKITKLPEGAISLGREAWNTIGNAEETKKWLQTQNVKTIILVTSNYHMPRSYYEFRHLVKGVDITAAPVPADDYNPKTWWLDPRYRTLIFMEFHKYLAALARNAFITSMREQ